MDDLNAQTTTPEAIIEYDPVLQPPVVQEPVVEVPAPKRKRLTWPSLKIGVRASGTYSVQANDVVYRAVARATVRRERLASIEPVTADGYEGYAMTFNDGSVRTILFYTVTATAGAPYMLELKDGKIVWATTKTIRYVNHQPVITDTQQLMRVPSTWADGQPHLCHTVLVQTLAADGSGLTARRLSRSLYPQSAWRFYHEQREAGLTSDDPTWVNPIANPTADFFTAALARDQVLAIRTTDRSHVADIIQAFAEDERVRRNTVGMNN